MDNIGFYSRSVSCPVGLTITMTLDAARGERPPALFGTSVGRATRRAVADCRVLVKWLLPGYDYTREIVLTEELGLGRHGAAPRRRTVLGFALCHTAPLVEGRSREETRVLKLVLEHERLISSPAARTRRLRAPERHTARRVPRPDANICARIGADLDGRPCPLDRSAHDARRAREPRPRAGLVWSNWEI